MARIVTLGEIMLRLKSPALERFFQSPSLEATNLIVACTPSKIGM